MIKLCRYFDILDPIMSERPSTRPLATNEEDDDVYNLSGCCDDIDETSDHDSESNIILEQEMSALDDNNVSIQSSISTNKSKQKKRKNRSSDLPINVWKQLEMSSQEISIKRLCLEGKRNEREEKKSELEYKILSEELEIKKLQAAEEKLRTRQGLKNAGICITEIDKLIPI